MRSPSRRPISLRRGLALLAVSALTLGGGAFAGGPAAADPTPPTPRGPATASSLPEKFYIEPIRVGAIDEIDVVLKTVEMTQLLLRRWAPGLAADGEYGPGTKAAVEKFQRSEGLAVTGNLERPDLYRLFTRQTVKYGDTGDAVRAAQMWLRYADPSSGVVVDGSFGPATRRAVIEDQNKHGRCHGTAADGIVGPMTRAMSFEYEWSYHAWPCELNP